MQTAHLGVMFINYGSSNKLLRCNKEKDSSGILRAVIMVKVTREH